MRMEGFRSRRWLDRTDVWGAEYRAYLRAEGFGPRMFDGRPIIGIAQSWSEFTSCHLHLREVAQAVKRGVLLAGGWPLEFPTIAISEALYRPSPLLLRNLMSMDVEESIRGLPMDGVVLLAGCDKNTPAYLLGAASAGLPTILVSAGPMQEGRWRGRPVAGSTCAFRRTCWPAGARDGYHPLPPTAEATASCISTTSSRHTWGVILISCAVAQYDKRHVDVSGRRRRFTLPSTPSTGVVMCPGREGHLRLRAIVFWALT